MPLVAMTDLLETALAGGYGVGYFEAWDGVSLEAVLEAAEQERAPVILGFGGMMVDDAWLTSRGIAMLGAMGRALVDRATVPVSYIFNEAQTLDQAYASLDAGFNAILLSTDNLSAPEALEVTEKLTRRAHSCGITVEAEVGHLPDAGAEGVDGEMTDPNEAADFVARTEVDVLAVSIGNVHIKTDGWAAIDTNALEAIRKVVTVPLAVHGGTSFPPDAVPHAVAHGVAKFNVGTIMKRLYVEALRPTTAGITPDADVHRLLGSHKPGDLTERAAAAVTTKVRELIRLYGGNGKA